MGIKEGKVKKWFLMALFAMPMLLASTHQQSNLVRKKFISETLTLQKTIQVLEHERKFAQEEIRRLEHKVLQAHKIIYLTDGISIIGKEEAQILKQDLSEISEKREDAIAQYQVILLEEYKNRDYKSKLYFLASSSSFRNMVNRLSHLSKLKDIRERQLKIIDAKSKEVENKLAVFNGTTQDKLELSEQKIIELQQLNDILRLKHLQVKKIEKEQNLLRLELIEKDNSKSASKEMIQEQYSNSSKAEVDNSTTYFWPVKKGLVVEQFGVHKHDVERKVQVENNGIDILVAANKKVFSIAAGEVLAIVEVPGMHSSIIIEHGKFRAVYANVSEIKVKKGDKIRGGIEIASVVQNKIGASTFHFEIWEGWHKRNPEAYLNAHL